jgi:hypothetical protein
MRIVLDRDTCTTILSACENCFASFLLRGCVPDRGCIMAVEDDGRPEGETTLLVRYAGNEAEVLVTDENRELLAYDGWSRYVDVAPEFFSPGQKPPEPLAS